MKQSKHSVEFEHPAKGADHCGECKYFIKAENACQRVVGHIEAADWCRLFRKRAEYE